MDNKRTLKLALRRNFYKTGNEVQDEVVYTILVNLVPTCVKCGSPETDLLEAEVEEQGQTKEGKVCQ